MSSAKFTQVFHPDSFSILYRQRAFSDQFEMGSQKQLILQLAGDFLCQTLQNAVIVGKQVAQFHFDQHLVIVSYRFDCNQIIATQFFKLHQYLFDLDREEVDPFQYDHVVAAAFETCQAFGASVRKGIRPEGHRSGHGYGIGTKALPHG